MMKSSKLVFFGNERLVSGLKHTDTPVLHALIAAGYDIRAIVSHHTGSRSRHVRPLEVATIAKAYDIPLLLPDKPADIIDTLASFNADAAILVAYGKIIPQRVIDVFDPIGIINLHPSLLPRHRGPTPIESTILQGDQEAGVSIMQLTAGMDEGPVYTQTRMPLHGNETKEALYQALSSAGTDLLMTALPDILSGKMPAVQQQNNDATYTSLFSASDGLIDVQTDDAMTCERKIRAYQDYPKARLRLADNDVIITMSKIVADNESEALIIPCAHHTWLEIVELIAPSGKRMSGEAFKHGYMRL